jgi:hypothetical protein
MVIEAFGMPDKILTGGPGPIPDGSGLYSVGYIYNSQKKNRNYSLHVSFYNSEEDNAATRAITRSMYKKLSREDRKLERERRKSFDVHHDYIARFLSLGGLHCYD